MRVLFVGDPHLKINRFDLATRFLGWLNELIAKEKPDLVVNLGDTFDTHAVLRSEVLNEYVKHVYHVLSMDIPYVYLLGNHDMYRPNDSKYHALLPFKGKIDNFHIIDKTQDFMGMTFVPYQYNGANFPRQTLPIVVAHQTFIGADYGPIRATEGVDATSIDGCEVIISGHIHTKSVLGSVLYVGSPFSQSAADVDQVKGITLLDTDTYKTTFSECPLPMWRRLVFTFDQQTGIGHLQQELANTVSNSKDHWVVELEGPKAEIVGYLGSKEYLKVIDGVDVKVKTKFTDNEKKKVAIEAKSMEHIVSEFVVKVYNGSIDKEELLARAKDILNESRLINKS
jgi:DNA repair exonuclease SbcCD nuclease subunit